MAETALLFLLCYVAGLGLALFASPVWGLYTYLAVFYLHPPSRWWGDMLPGIRWALLAAAVTLIAVLLHRNRQSDRPRWYGSTIAICLIAYTAWMWVQTPFVVSPWHSEGAVLFTKYLVLLFLIHQIIDDRDKLRDFLLANIVGGAYFGILVYLAPDAGRLEGVGGPGLDNSNSLGMHLGAVLMFASFLLLATKGWRRWVILGSIPLILNGLIQTESRGAIVGVLAGGLVAWYLKPKRIRKTFYVLSGLALVGVMIVANQAFMSRMTEAMTAAKGEEEWDGSAYSRIEIAKAQFRMFADYPLGAGHQGTTALSRKYLDEQWMAAQTGDRASHNTLLSVLVDQGIVGIVLFSVLMFSTLRSLVRLKRYDKFGISLDLGLYRTAVAAALATVFGAGMFADYLKAEVTIWCLMMICLLIEFAEREVSGLETADAEARTNKVGGRPVRSGV